jgi:hypothetical protein
MITIILTVSRDNYLEKVITSIELLECDNASTNILCVVDGSPELYVKTRNLINGTKFNQRLTVEYKGGKPVKNLDIKARRARIADIHNFAKTHIQHNDGYILSIEDDTTFNKKALSKLLKVANTNRAFGMAEGVELGRWGVPYVGGWIADDIYEPKLLTSVENLHGTIDGRVTKIDAGGLYFALMRTDLYKQHEFTSKNGLGPDINFGLENRQLGFDNFIVWNVPCSHHYNNKGTEAVITPKENSKEVKLKRQNAKKWSVHY